MPSSHSSPKTSSTSRPATVTDVLIRVCRKLLEANRQKLDNDPDIRGIELRIRLTDTQQLPKTALLSVLQEMSLTSENCVDPETYIFHP